MDSLEKAAPHVQSPDAADAPTESRPVVWLVISSYRNDQEILQTLEHVHLHQEKLFGQILVVDSEGTGEVPRMVAHRGWRDVTYRSYDVNLGSGANLRERLRLAAEGGADYAYAINHDASLDFRVVTALVEAARSIQNLGAAYPLAYFSSAGRYNLTGTRELPLSRKLVASVNQGPLIDVFWSSSNGALYSTHPPKRGVLPWEEMWMGLEDLEYGWRLSDHGYRQVIVTDAVFQDNNEYVSTKLGRVTSKPAWRTYYFSRNLILAIRRSRKRPLFFLVTAYRIVLEAGLILLARSTKIQRLRYLWLGTIDGIRGAAVRRQIP